MADEEDGADGRDIRVEDDRDIRSALKTITRGAGLTFVGLIFGRFLSYLTRIVAARYLGPSDYGIFALGLSILGILVIFPVFGMNVGLTRHISYYLSKDKKEKAFMSILSSVKIVLAVSILIAIAVMLLSDAISFLVFKINSLTPVLIIVALTVPFAALEMVLSAAVVGFKAIKYKIIAEDFVKSSTKLIFLAIFVILGYSSAGAVAGYLIGFVLSVLVLIMSVKKLIGQNFKDIISYKMDYDILKFSWPLMLVSLIGVLMTQTDTVILGVLGTTTDVGIYNASAPTASMVVIILHALLALFLPMISGFYAQKKEREIDILYKKMFGWVFILSFPILMIVGAYSSEILTIAFGSEFSRGNVALSILSIGYFISGAALIPTEMLIMIKRTKTSLFIAFSSLLLNIVLNFYFIPIYGILGAAVATTISFLFLLVGLILFIKIYFKKLPINSMFIRIIIPIILSAATFAAFRYVTSSNAPSVAAGLIVYLVLLLLLKTFDERDIELFKSIKHKLIRSIGYKNKGGI